ncbi:MULTISPECIES: hypothetical protein [Arthrobacter]|uniref:Lipoprotein n=1 Tax=Arthrobacter terricola TaxID=2547396 RepID=A0A4R5KKE7_9MICC|nr:MULTISPECIES: hypothetical protein [Arthrobacter]MBT8161654.1 hypothetical protein [Arthrobacter sp. GN70]TDF95315.1 hypothetical protein E1809_12435 [Arthrobacter terricola]
MSKERLVTLAAVGFAVSLGMSACSAVAANTTATPTTADEARTLARAVADKAGCGSFEDYIVNSRPDWWKFTCQIKDDTFSIVASRSPKARSDDETHLKETGQQYWTQDSYSIVAVPKSNSKSTIGAISPDLEPFKKALDRSK